METNIQRVLTKKVATPVSLVLPMFNEASVVDHTLREAITLLECAFADFEIVVADDASTDDCVELVARWVARDPRIKLVRLARNQKFGGALRAGFNTATKDWLVYTDFDLPIELDSLPRLLDAFADVDVLTGISLHKTKHPDWKQAVVSQIYNVMVRTLFRIQLRDINFGFKAIRKTSWDQLCLRSRSPFVDAELFICAERLGLRIKQIPVPFSERKLGASNIRRLDVIIQTLFDMLLLRVRLWCHAV
jgi:glycosyltransferase involved in cell wall biosynthesis